MMRIIPAAVTKGFLLLLGVLGNSIHIFKGEFVTNKGNVKKLSDLSLNGSLIKYQTNYLNHRQKHNYFSCSDYKNN